MAKLYVDLDLTMRFHYFARSYGITTEVPRDEMIGAFYRREMRTHGKEKCHPDTPRSDCRDKARQDAEREVKNLEKEEVLSRLLQANGQLPREYDYSVI